MELMDIYIPYGPGKRCGVSVYAGKMIWRRKGGRWRGIRFMFYLEHRIDGEWCFKDWRFLTIPIRRIANT